jgi:3'-phosphoadenosine 5'-phosphosulfate sulfotransferase (PAPS reductase)/FAD synthetase
MSGNKYDANALKQFQSLSLEHKIRMSKERIKAWYESWVRFKIENLDTGKIRWATFDMRDRYDPPIKENEFAAEAYSGSVYVSFSGGKDSTVLADLCAQVCEWYGWTLYLCFVNTGLEYPEIQKFVRSFADWLSEKYDIEVVLDVIRPEMRFDQVLKTYGYPVISKEVSQTVCEARKNAETGKYAYRLKKLNGEAVDKEGNPSQYNIPQHKPLLDVPFLVSHRCCDVMKKAPAKQYEKETGRLPMIATLASESRLRRSKWIKSGCNAFDLKRPTSQPLSFWTEQDILHYLKKYDVPYCSVYGDIRIKPHGEYASDAQIDIIDYLGCYEPEDTLMTTGCERTGCIFCLFGCHLEKGQSRFQRLKETHPRQYEYCIGGGAYSDDGIWQPNKQGLGLGHVCDTLNEIYGEDFIRYK